MAAPTPPRLAPLRLAVAAASVRLAVAAASVRLAIAAASLVLRQPYLLGSTARPGLQPGSW